MRFIGDGGCHVDALGERRRTRGTFGDQCAPRLRAAAARARAAAAGFWAGAGRRGRARPPGRSHPRAFSPGGVVEKLREVDGYADAFQRAFGSPASTSDAMARAAGDSVRAASTCVQRVVPKPASA